MNSLMSQVQVFFIGQEHYRYDKFLKPSLIIFISLALALSFFHFETLNARWMPERSGFHERITSGNQNAPHQYRVLGPYGVHIASWPVIKLLGLEEPSTVWKVRELFYIALRLSTIFLLLVFFYLFLRNWFSQELALAGTLLLGALHFYSFHAYYYQPSSNVNLMFLALFAHWTVQGHQKRLWLLSVIGSLARETSGIMASLYLCHHGFSRKAIIGVLPIVMGWLLVQVALRAIFGVKLHDGGQDWFITLQPQILLWPILLYSLMWVIPLFKFRSLPPFFQRAMFLFVPPIVLVNFIFGEIQEARLFLDLALVIIPSTMYVLFGSLVGEKDARSDSRVLR